MKRALSISALALLVSVAGLAGPAAAQEGINMDQLVWTQEPIAQTAAVEQSTMIQEIQAGLTKLGYNTRGTDGRYTYDTEAAITRYQVESGLAANGEVSRSLYNHIRHRL